MDNIIKKDLSILSITVLIPLSLAVLIRGIFLYYWILSPFQYYSYIPTLDMNQLMIWGIEAAKTGRFNSLYSLFLSLIYNVAGSKDFLLSVIIVQLFLGIFTVILSTYIGWYLTKNKLISFLSGCFIAAYGPLMMYEGFVLKSTLFTFISTLLLFYVLYSKSKRFRKADLVTIGIIAGLLLLIRFSGVTWAVLAIVWVIFNTKFNINNSIILKHVTEKLIGFSYIAAGIILIIGAVIVYNNNANIGALSALNNREWFSYIASVGSQVNLDTVNSKIVAQEDVQLKSTTEKHFHIAPFFKKSIIMFSANEVPNNLNYYFIKNGLFILKYLITPFFIFIVGLSGLLIFILFRKNVALVSVVILFVISIIVPAGLFVPLARYKVVITPLLCIFSAFFIIECFNYIKYKKFLKLTIATAVLILFISAQFYYLSKNLLRSSDFISYGKALEYQNAPNERIIEAYRFTYESKPYDTSLTLKYTAVLMQNGYFKKASRILSKSYTENSDNVDIALEYSSALLGERNISKAGDVLKKIKIKNIDDSKYIYYLYNLGEYCFMDKNYSEALKCYELLLNEKGQINRLYIKQKIKFIKTKYLE
ncbi:MAG: tetratricopeptide repeat protein [bacterium]|nr:tetratricopeptide repeat protein [bacterium]